MTTRTARLLAVGLVLAAVGIVAAVWLARQPAPLPEDHAQIDPGARFDDPAEAVDVIDRFCAEAGIAPNF